MALRAVFRMYCGTCSGFLREEFPTVVFARSIMSWRLTLPLTSISLFLGMEAVFCAFFLALPFGRGVAVAGAGTGDGLTWPYFFAVSTNQVTNLLVSSLYRPYLLDRTSGSIFSKRNEGGLDNSTEYGGVRISGYEVRVLWMLVTKGCAY